MSHFNGPEYIPERDHDRLSKQHSRIKNVMSDGSWRTLAEIATLTGDPEASVSAQLRHLRKPRFGSYEIERRHRGEKRNGLFEYRLVLPGEQPTLELLWEKPGKKRDLLREELKLLRELEELFRIYHEGWCYGSHSIPCQIALNRLEEFRNKSMTEKNLKKSAHRKMVRE